jgi:diaminopimelate decarboxylase
MMGAYTACSASDFNFIPRAKVVALNAQARAARAD